MDLGPAVGLVFSLLIIGPQLVAAIAYARLFSKTDDRTQRYRIALITGANKGIGLEVVRQLATRGWRVFLTGRSLASVRKAASPRKPARARRAGYRRASAAPRKRSRSGSHSQRSSTPSQPRKCSS